MEMLAAKADPGHERRAEFDEWIDLEGFDPTAVDIQAIDHALLALARRWSRKPAARKRRAV
jgi:hypothetical protein